MPLGNLVEQNGRVYLETRDGWLISAGRRYCTRCGKEIHFNRPQRSYAELLQAQTGSQLGFMNRTPPAQDGGGLAADKSG